MKLLFSLLVILTVYITPADAQVKFRSGMFFHHSTGFSIWGPNGSGTSVPQQMTIYNNAHGYTGANAITMSELWFPVNFDNEWFLWHEIFQMNTPESISSYYNSNKIIMVKSCFPSSAIEGVGEPADTLSPDYKTIYNYKWHWRNIIQVMKTRPQNFFVIWTNAPLVELETTPSSAMWSKQFCKWAKDTLAQGLDPEFGAFPNNVYVFDFFSKLANTNGYMLPQYATDAHDSHPNAAATTLVSPQLVNEVFDHSIAYEQVYGIRKIDDIIPNEFRLHQNYPNPFNPTTKIKFSIVKGFPNGTIVNDKVLLKVYDVMGREVQTLVNERLQPGTYEASFDGSKLNSGVYFYKLIAADYIETKTMLLIK